jgi:chromosome segregation ATPase
MTEETLAAPVATAEIPATETPETPAVETSTDAPAPEKDERDKAIARMERRINRKHAEAAEAKAERDFLREQLQKYEAQREPEETTEVDPKQFERAVSQKAAELAESREFDRQCNEVAAKGAKKFSDFQDAVNALTAELPLFDKRGPTAAMKVVLEADKPEALLHYLGKNLDLASELADLTPTQLSRRLDRIEREMATPKTSAAPKPLDPVKPQATASNQPRDSDSVEEWMRKERERMGRRF